MKRSKITSITVLSNGILMMTLGIIHLLAIFIVKEDYKKQMNKESLTELLTWFGVGGMYFILLGVIVILCFSGLKMKMGWAWMIALTVILFELITSLAGIIIFREGPPIFIFAIALIALIPILMNRKMFQNVPGTLPEK